MLLVFFTALVYHEGTIVESVGAGSERGGLRVYSCCGTAQEGVVDDLIDFFSLPRFQQYMICAAVSDCHPPRPFKHNKSTPLVTVMVAEFLLDA